MTGKEQTVYEYIASSLRSRGVSPSVRDIAHATGIGSTSTVSRLLDSLEEQGMIRREKGVSRSIQIDSYTVSKIKADNPGRTVRVPIFYDINILSAGLPPENIEGYIDFPLMGRIYEINSLFAFRAERDGMADGVLRGDILIARKSRVPEVNSKAVAIKNGQIEIIDITDPNPAFYASALILGRIISVVRFC